MLGVHHSLIFEIISWALDTSKEYQEHTRTNRDPQTKISVCMRIKFWGKDRMQFCLEGGKGDKRKEEVLTKKYNLKN